MKLKNLTAQISTINPLLSILINKEIALGVSHTLA